MKNDKTINFLHVGALASLLFTTACWDKLDKTLKVYQFLGSAAFVLAILIYPFRHKISAFLKGKKGGFKVLLLFGLLFLLLETRAFGQDISFEPAIETFMKICRSFAQITAGTCGFYGLTRVGWLLVNEDRSCGTAFVMSIIGFFCCTIAVGLLG